MQLIQQPPQELQRISHLGDLKPLPASIGALLQQLMGRDLSLERLGVPHLPAKHAEPLDQLRGVRVRSVGVEDKVIAEGEDVYEGVEDRVHVRVGFDVIQSYETGVVRLLVKVVGRRGAGVDGAEELRGEGRVEEVLDIVEGRIIDFVAVGKNVNLLERTWISDWPARRRRRRLTFWVERLMKTWLSSAIEWA